MSNTIQKTGAVANTPTTNVGKAFGRALDAVHGAALFLGLAPVAGLQLAAGAVEALVKRDATDLKSDVDHFLGRHQAEGHRADNVVVEVYRRIIGKDNDCWC